MLNLKQKNINKKALVLVLVIFGLLVFGFGKIRAYDLNCDGKVGSELDNCIKDAQNKAADIRQLIQLKAKQETVLQNQMQLIDLEQQKNSTQFKDEQERLAELTQQIYDIENQIAEKEKLVSQQRDVLAALMRAYQESFNEGISGIVLIGTNIPRMFSQSDYLDQTSFKINEVLQTIRDAKKDLEQNKTKMVGKKSESEQVKADLQKRGLTLQSNEDLKTTQVLKTQAEKSKYEKLLADINDEIDQIEAGKGEANLASLPPLKKGYFTYPVNPIVVSQSYGKTSFSSHYAGGKHNGIDFSIKYGKIYAAKSGTVIATGMNSHYAYGNWIAIDHGDGLVTLYGHFSKLMVSRGTSVSEGQTIGISGSTGFSTGPHLHFSVFSRSSFEVTESTKVKGLMLPVGASVNPMRYL